VNWSEESRRIVAEIARQHPQATGKELRRLFRDAYPFGPRAYWPYKAWLTACRRQIDAREGRAPALRPREPEAGQISLFGGAA
jgi:hypothetical protein